MASAEKTTIETLTAMKAKIETAKTEKARLEGQLADRMARLKALGFDSVEAAEARLVELADHIAELDGRVQRGVEELQGKYGL